jgi:uncharacterized membrane protein (UPF0127 family)
MTAGAWVRVVNTSQGGAEVVRARLCATFLCRFRGLMFSPPLEAGRGLLLVEAAESRVGTAIHMAFVAYPLAVAWLDAGRRVVDCRLARPWRLYLPARRASYILEGEPVMLQRLAVNDLLDFVDVEAA